MRYQTQCFVLGAAGMVFLLGGCTATTPQQTDAQRQDAILNDPMGYKPQVGGNVSGGDTGNFDKSGFNQDLHDMFDP